jgi:hypothetical protein
MNAPCIKSSENYSALSKLHKAGLYLPLSFTQYDGPYFFKENMYTLSIVNIHDIALNVLLQVWKLLKDGFL